jgi:hypothetical protein
VPFSMRHPSSSEPQAETEPDQRHVSADHRDDVAAGRAGRPGRLAGVLGCRRLASSASRTIAPRWSRKGGARLSAVPVVGSPLAGAATSVDKVLPGCSRTFARDVKPAGVGLPWFTPAGGASTASTRGKGAR